MSAGRHQEVGGQTSRSQPADFTLYKNMQYKNTKIKNSFPLKGRRRRVDKPRFVTRRIELINWIPSLQSNRPPNSALLPVIQF
jgi:hypothetical protein